MAGARSSIFKPSAASAAAARCRTILAERIRQDFIV
jgi:hypothetical protein